MLRKIIKIDADKCNGCGLCVTACHEGAIGLKNGKAVLLRDDYCDGLGDCLPACPTGAITFEEREAAPYDEAAVLANMRKNKPGGEVAGGCPGMRAALVETKRLRLPPAAGGAPGAQATYGAPEPAAEGAAPSRLRQWPVQIKLAPVNAPYFAGADLLIAADCTAFACADMHERFMKGRITLIGCPKLDEEDYSQKLTAIFMHNEIKSVSVARMEVPCCSGLVQAVKRAIHNSGKDIPLNVQIIAIDGSVAPDGEL